LTASSETLCTPSAALAAGTALAAASGDGRGTPRASFVTLTTIGLIAPFALPVFSDASTATSVVPARAPAAPRRPVLTVGRGNASGSD
jgi:hypothetical protein